MIPYLILDGEIAGLGKFQLFGPAPFSGESHGICSFDIHIMRENCSCRELPRLADELEGVAHKIRSYALALEVRS